MQHIRSAEETGLYKVYTGKMMARLLSVSVILLPSYMVAFGHLNAARSERQFKEALIDLAASHPAPIRIASNEGRHAFEARAELVWLPYCDDQTARRFLAKTGVTHVVLGDHYVSTAYQKKWMEEGVPEARKIVDLSSTVTGSRLKIYELDK